MKRLIPLLILFLPYSTMVFAQQDPAKAPKQALAKLSGIVGNWTVDTYYYDQKAQAFSQQAQSVTAIKLILNDLGIRQQDIKLVQGKTVGIDITYGYDQYRKVYRLFVLDDGWGVPDVYEGNIVGDQLIATNIGNGTAFPLANGDELVFRFTMDLSGDNRLVLIHMSDNQGQDWLPMYRYEYKRID